MKITIYELLEMIKDGKAPKKIKYNNDIYEYEDCDYFGMNMGYLFDGYNVSGILNTEVEILEEEKKIPEKIEEFGLIQYNLDYIDYKNIETLKEWLNKDFQTIYDTLDLLIKNQNQLIDYFKSKGE